MLVLVLAGLLPGTASAAGCGTTTVTGPFQRWGDAADYTLVPGGSFEGGAAGWTLSGARVAAGNEPWRVRASTDTTSLAIGPLSKAVSAPFCVSTDHPYFRFFARKTSGVWARMNIYLRWSDGYRTRDTFVDTLSADSDWAPTRVLPLAGALPIAAGGSLKVQIVFDPQLLSGAWAIDDVFYDPYRR